MWLWPVFPYKISHFSLVTVPKLSRDTLTIFWCAALRNLRASRRNPPRRYIQSTTTTIMAALAQKALANKALLDNTVNSAFMSVGMDIHVLSVAVEMPLETPRLNGLKRYLSPQLRLPLRLQLSQ